MANVEALLDAAEAFCTALTGSVMKIGEAFVNFHVAMFEYLTTVATVVNEAQALADTELHSCPPNTIPVFDALSQELIECMRKPTDEDIAAENDECPEGYSAYLTEDTYGNEMTFCSKDDDTYSRADVRREMLGEALAGG